MKKSFFIFNIFIFMSSLVPRAYAQDIYTLVKSESYELVEDWSITNSGEDVKDFDLNVNLSKKIDSPYQKNDEIEVSNASIAKNDSSNDLENINSARVDFIPKNQTIHIGTTKRFTGSGIKYNVDLSKTKGNYSSFSDFQKYISPGEKIESENPLIKKQADSLVGTEKNPYLKAKKIFEFANTKIEYDEKEGNKGALNALNTRKGVCEDFADLFVAMARAENVPSRMVYGYRIDHSKFINNVENLENSAHAWAEFYLPEYGWIMVEPTVIFTDSNNKRYVSYTDFANAEKGDHVIVSYSGMDKISYSYKSSSTAKLDIKRTVTIKKIHLDSPNLSVIDTAQNTNATDNSVSFSFKYPHKCDGFNVKVYSAESELVNSIVLPYTEDGKSRGYVSKIENLKSSEKYIIKISPFLANSYGKEYVLNAATSEYNLSNVNASIISVNSMGLTLSINHNKSEGDKIKVFDKNKKLIKELDFSDEINLDVGFPSLFNRKTVYYIQVENKNHNKSSDKIEINANIPRESFMGMIFFWYDRIFK